MLNEMDDIRKGLDVVANHWSKTKTPGRAITFLLQYGDICLHSFDCNAATEVFDRIIQVGGGFIWRELFLLLVNTMLILFFSLSWF